MSFISHFRVRLHSGVWHSAAYFDPQCGGNHCCYGVCRLCLLLDFLILLGSTTGKVLPFDVDPSQLQTYISRDGGCTWNKARQR